MPAIGRPTKLTPERLQAILEHVKLGAGLKTAAEHELVTEFAAMSWQRKGRAILSRIEAGEEPELNDREERYLAFAQGVARARAEFEIAILRRLDTLDAGRDVTDPKTGEVQRVNNIDPKIAAAIAKSLTWLLERTRRETYGSQITIKVEEAKNFLLESLERVCERLGAPEVLEALIDELDGDRSEVAEAASAEANRIH
jgi:hypothetical protein